MNTIVPTKVYNQLLNEELERRRPPSDLWAESWGDYNDLQNRQRIGRNILTAQKIYEYQTRGLRDDLRHPWLAR